MSEPEQFVRAMGQNSVAGSREALKNRSCRRMPLLIEVLSKAVDRRQVVV